MTPVKLCLKCNQVKSFSDFHINNATKTGRNTYCKVCCTEIHKAQFLQKYSSKIKQLEKEISSGKKKCQKCLVVRPLEMFSKRKPFAKQKQSIRKITNNFYRDTCKCCVKKSLRKKYILSPEAKKRKQELNRKYNRIRNITVREINKAEYTFMKDLMDQIVSHTFEKFKHRCFKCKSEKSLQIDHHYPISLGNPLSIENSVLLCVSCNKKKSNRLPEEFYSKEELEDLQINYGIKQMMKSI